MFGRTGSNANLGIPGNPILGIAGIANFGIGIPGILTLGRAGRIGSWGNFNPNENDGIVGIKGKTSTGIGTSNTGKGRVGSRGS